MVDKKRIAKNSLWLYMRMLVVTLVSLYTSRIVLKALGVTDFGIYNATGSLVSFFTVLTTSMSNGTQRFFNIKKGEGDIAGMKKLLGISVNLYVLIAGILLLLAETVGIYLLLNVMNLPQGRMFDAFWVYQPSLVVLVFSFLKVPYLALVVTYEKFSFIAWTSLLDVVFKLFLAFMLESFNEYRLIFYAFTFAVLAILQFVVFKIYSQRFNKPTFVKLGQTFKEQETKDLVVFSSWNILGNFSSIMANQGICVILNVFYSVVVNAAMGISNQVTNTIATMVSTVQQAFRPQMMQSYVNEDKRSFIGLLYDTTRWSFLVIMFIAGPLVCNIRLILNLWLGEYPLYSDSFIIILVAYLIVDSVSIPLSNAIDATGYVKRFQLSQTILNLVNVLFAYIVCDCGFGPEYAVLTKVVANIVLYIVKVKEVSRTIQAFSFEDYFSNVLKRILLIEVFLVICVLCLMQLQVTLLNVLLSMSLYYCAFLSMGYFYGLSKKERVYLCDNICRKFR